MSFCPMSWAAVGPDGVGVGVGVGFGVGLGVGATVGTSVGGAVRPGVGCGRPDEAVPVDVLGVPLPGPNGLAVGSGAWDEQAARTTADRSANERFKGLG